MDLNATFQLALKVLTDWRVIAITAAVLLLWAALRYVGSVYRSRPAFQASRFASLKPKPGPAGKGSGGASKAAARGESEEE
jgi:hypothetical protein